MKIDLTLEAKKALLATHDTLPKEALDIQRELCEQQGFDYDELIANLKQELETEP